MSELEMPRKVLRDVVRIAIRLHDTYGAHARLLAMLLGDMFHQVFPVEVRLLAHGACESRPVHGPITSY